MTHSLSPTASLLEYVVNIGITILVLCRIYHYAATLSYYSRRTIDAIYILLAAGKLRPSTANIYVGYSKPCYSYQSSGLYD